ncbi:MAG: hypothetical protein RL529_259 [Actinomycetota bacterium]
MVDRLVSNSAWWLRVLLVYFASRVLTFALFLITARTQGDNYWTKANPPYFDFLNIWDVEWYGKIFSNGYPTVLPLAADGSVAQNEWAFLPGFPAAVKAFAFTGIEWKYLAPLVATMFGAGFALVAYRVFAAKLNDKQALWAVGLFLISPASPILQTGYAESLGLLLMALVLYYWITDRFWLVLLSMTALAFTRPGLAAFALAFAVGWVYRFVQARMGGRGFGWLDALKLGGLALAAVLLNLAWPLVAAINTGRHDAYVATELAWRSSYPFGGGGLNPVLPWFSSAEYFIGGDLGRFVVVLAILGAVAIFFVPQVKQLGLDVNAFAAAYFAYLLIFFFPQSSILRILMPTFVLYGALAQVYVKWSRGWRIAAVIVLVLLQFGWLLTCWRYQAPDFSPP